MGRFYFILLLPFSRFVTCAAQGRGLRRDYVMWGEEPPKFIARLIPIELLDA